MSVFTIIFFLTPIIIGLVVFFLKSEIIVSRANKLNNWTIEQKKKNTKRSGFFSEYFLRPFFWGLFKIMTWTEHRFKDKFLRSSVRITLTLYFIALFVFIITCLALFVIGIIFGIVYGILLLCFIFLMFYLIDIGIAGDKGFFGKEGTEIEVKRSFFRTTKIERAVFSDDRILKDEMGGKVGTLSKAIISDDQIIKDASGNIVGRITQSIYNEDVQVIKNDSGNKVGEIKSDVFGNRIIIDSKGGRIGTIKKNVLGETTIKI